MPPQEGGIFNFLGHTLLSHGLLLRNPFAAALGVSHSLNFNASDMATRCLEGPNTPRLDDRVFDAAMQAFNDLAARSRIQHVCSRADRSHLYTSEVEAAEAEARKAGSPLRAEQTEGSIYLSCQPMPLVGTRSSLSMAHSLLTRVRCATA
jgi:hypothetical protein